MGIEATHRKNTLILVVVYLQALRSLPDKKMIGAKHKGDTKTCNIKQIFFVRWSNISGWKIAPDTGDLYAQNTALITMR